MPLHLKEELVEMIRSVRNEITDFFVCDFHIYNENVDDINSCYFNISNFKDVDEFDVCFETSNFENIDDINVCLDSMIWTIQGTVNKISSVEQIIEKTNLCTRKKYELACNNCLEGKIRDLIRLLPDDFIESYLKNKKKLFSLVLFWTFYVRGEEEKFSEVIKGVDPLNYLLAWACRFDKGPVFQFFCENLFQEERKNRFDRYVSFAHSPNIFFYIFLQLKISRQRRIHVDHYYNFLRKLHSISKWYNSISVEKIVIDLIRFKEVSDALQIVLFCRVENLLYYNQYLNLWKEFSFHFKLDDANRLREFGRNCMYGRQTREATNQDLLTVRLLLEMATDQQKIILLQRHDLVDLGVQLFSKRLYTFDFFLLEFMKEVNQDVSFKSVMNPRLEFEYMNILSKMISRGKLEVIPVFLNRFDGAKEAISKYKGHLPYSKVKKILDNLFSDCDKENLDIVDVLNNFFVWAFDGNEEEITRYKRIVFNIKGIRRYKTFVYNVESESFYDYQKKLINKLRNLMFEKDWGLVRKYWKFIVSANKDELCTVKIKWLFIENFIFSNFKESYKLHLLLVESRTRFLDSCFNNDELDELKEELKGSDYFCKLVCDVLRVDHLKANYLLNWCFSCVQIEIDEYKSLFMNKHLCSVLSNLILMQDFDEKSIRQMLVWFNPSVEQANLIKERFPTIPRDESGRFQLRQKARQIFDPGKEERQNHSRTIDTYCSRQ